MCENVPDWSPAHYWQKKKKTDRGSVVESKITVLVNGLVYGLVSFAGFVGKYRKKYLNVR